MQVNSPELLLSGMVYDWIGIMSANGTVTYEHNAGEFLFFP